MKNKCNFSQILAATETPLISVADPEGEGGTGGSLEAPSPIPVFKYPMKTKQFGLSETKLYHFHGIVKTNRNNQ